MTAGKPRLEEELGGAAAAEVLHSMAGKLRAARVVVITAHVHPDGDALGSELALASALSRLGKRVRVVNDHPAPEKYRFLDPRSEVEVLAGPPPADALRGVDLAVLLDTSEPSRTGRLEPAFFAPGLERICLDHHPGPVNPLFALHWVAPRAPATGSLVLRLLDALGVEPGEAEAVPLLVAIATDTGWFRFENASPLALRDAARLVAAGARPDRIYPQIYEDSSPARAALLGRLLQGIQVELGGRFIWSLLDKAALERSGVPYEEIDGFSEALKSVRGAEVAALLVETDPGQFKVSLRSRGEAAVNGIAGRFGGGGHAKAAGYRTGGSPQEAVGALRAEVTRALGA
jgi:bifunctional oligoribonuclease and PAP phosphatase NrnA